MGSFFVTASNELPMPFVSVPFLLLANACLRMHMWVHFLALSCLYISTILSSPSPLPPFTPPSPSPLPPLSLPLPPFSFPSPALPLALCIQVLESPEEFKHWLLTYIRLLVESIREGETSAGC